MRKYGEDRVAQIITFGTLQAKAVLRDVGRVMQLPFPRGRQAVQACAFQSCQSTDASRGD